MKINKKKALAYCKKVICILIIISFLLTLIPQFVFAEENPTETVFTISSDSQEVVSDEEEPTYLTLKASLGQIQYESSDDVTFNLYLENTDSEISLIPGEMRKVGFPVIATEEIDGEQTEVRGPGYVEQDFTLVIPANYEGTIVVNGDATIKTLIPNIITQPDPITGEPVEVITYYEEIQSINLESPYAISVLQPKLLHIEIVGEDILEASLTERVTSKPYQAYSYTFFGRPLKNEGYTYLIEDGSGNNLTMGSHGVEINPETGVVTLDIQQNIAVNEFYVSALRKGVAAETYTLKRVTIKKQNVPAEIKIERGERTNPQDRYDVPLTGESITGTYIAKVLDSEGNELPEYAPYITWSVTGDAYAYLEDEKVGKVTLTSDVTAESLTLTATLNMHDMVLYKDIVLHLNNNVPRRIEITGKDKLAIPRNDAFLTETYTATVYNSQDKEIAFGDLIFSLRNAPNGVDITPDGILTVSENAEPGIFQIVCRENITGLTEYYIVELVEPTFVASIQTEVDRESPVLMMALPGEEKDRLIISAKAIDANGLPVLGEEKNIAFSLALPVIGVGLIDHGDGTATLISENQDYPDIASRTIDVIVTYTAPDGYRISDTLEVTLVPQMINRVEVDDNPAKAYIFNDRNNVINLTARAYDQYDKEILGPSKKIVWIVDSLPTGISLTEDGILTIAPSAEEGSLYIIGRAVDDEGNFIAERGFTLVLERQNPLPVPTFIRINGQKTITINPQKEVVAHYTAGVYSQYDTLMEEERVTFSLNPAHVEGVSIEHLPGEVLRLTVSPTALPRTFELIAQSVTNETVKTVFQITLKDETTDVEEPAEPENPEEPIDNPEDSEDTEPSEPTDPTPEEPEVPAEDDPEEPEVPDNQEEPVIDEEDLVPASIIIIGKDTLPIHPNQTTQEAYQAEVRNSAGKVIQSNVRWSIEGNPEGVIVDKNGVVTISAGVNLSSIVLKASVGDNITATKTITLVNALEDAVNNITATISFNLSSLVANKNLTATAKVHNQTASPQTVTLVLALYEGDVFKNASYTTATIKANEERNITASFKLPSSVKNVTVKSFLWLGDGVINATMPLLAPQTLQ